MPAGDPVTAARPAGSNPARRSSSGKVPSFGEGRPCAVDGCSTVLSRYNAGTTCSAHDENDESRERARTGAAGGPGQAQAQNARR